MTDLYTLGLEVRSDGVVVASNRLNQLAKDGKNAEDSTKKLSTATSSLVNYMKAAAAAFGLYKLAEYAKESALLAARYQTLGVVMNTVGATAGYTNVQMAAFEKTLQKQGIAMVESRQVLTQMAQAHLDLAKSSELARVAQDAATIGGINSSEAFERMVAGIQKGETEILKTIGINVNFEQSYVKMAATLGKSRDALSETEKSTARMNAVLERGKDIAGVYEAAMGTSGKQLTSLKRYIDNIKVAFGEAFGPLLITVIETATAQLKIIEKWFDDNPSKVKEWGLTLLSYLYQASAEFLRLGMLLDKIGGTLTSTQMLLSGPGAALGNAGATKRFEAAAQANIDFEERYNQKDKMIEGLAAKMNDVEARIEQAQKGTIGASKTDEAAKSAAAELEARQMAAGAAAKQVQVEEELALLVKKNRDQWAGIVVEQLESVGAYSHAAAKQIELNKLTDEYKTMQKAALEVPEAAAALRAQELLDHQNLMEAKRKELQLETDHHGVMLDIEAQKLATLGYDQESIYLKNGYLQALDEEKILQDQIATEINPKKKAQMEEQLSAQQELNRLIRSETEERKRINDLLSQSAAYNDLIKMAKAAGADTKQLEVSATQAAYDAKRAQYQKAISDAQNAGNDTLASITQQTLTQLETMFAQKNANDENLSRLREILGVQQGITSEVSKQKDNNALIDEYNASIVQTRTRDEQYEYDKYTVSGIGHAELGHFYGIFYGMVEEAAKQRIREYEAETAAVQAAIDAKAAETAAAEAAAAAEEQRRKALQMQISAISNASSALRSLAGDAGSLAASLRSAAENLRQARIDIAGGDTSVLSPEQQYNLARDAFNQTLAQANATGDVELFNRLPQLAQEFLTASQGYNASNSVFGQDYASVQAALLAAGNNADAYATEAEIMQSLLTQQVELLDAIRTALEEGGDTASLLSQLNGINNTIAGHTGNTVAGLGSSGNLYGVLNLGLGATGTIGSRLGTTAASGSLAALMEAVRAKTSDVGTYTNSTYGVLNGSLLSSQDKGRVSGVTDTYKYKPLSTTQIESVTSAYTYYAKGGIANDPTGRSIFGEAGPEAAVPLPDGRTIPVTLYGSADGYDRELMQEILAELKALTRVQVAGNNGIIAPLKGMEKRLAGVENKARLAANQ